MTREEAAEYLKDTLAYIKDEKELKPIKTKEEADKEMKNSIESFEMAIKALQEPNTCERCINAKECIMYEPNMKRCKGYRQEPILDKIRAEIEKTTSRYTISRERGAMGQVEWSDRLIKESEVLEIIDKYKAESEDKI